jgi:hypothetical protein
MDEVLFTNERKVGVEVCFLDRSGSFIQAHTMIFPFKVTTLECKVTALQHGFVLAIANGFERVIFKSVYQ